MKKLKLECPVCSHKFVENVRDLNEKHYHMAECSICEHAFYYEFSFELKLKKTHKPEKTKLNEKEQIKEFEQLNRSGKLLQHVNRSGYIFFAENGFVYFFEIHRQAETVKSLQFEAAINELLDAAYEDCDADIPNYKFTELWQEVYNQQPITGYINELKSLNILNYGTIKIENHRARQLTL
jgi:hypothetical protein